MLRDALSYPYKTGADNLIAGGLLILFSLFLFPFILISGYFVRVYRDSINPTRDPPEIPGTALTQLLKDGSLYMGIAFVYGIIPLSLLGLTAPIIESGGAIGEFVFATVISLCVTAGATAPIAMLRAVETENPRAAFHLQRIASVLFTPRYLLTLAYLFLLWLSFLFTLSILAVIIGLGWLLMPVVVFYTGVVAHRLLGTTYADIQEKNHGIL